jgi:uncharacterized membrane protein YidH (DUF202 family)
VTSEPAPEVPADNRGFARERTALAWNRSGLAGIVCVAVLLRRLWPLRGGSQLLALGLVAVAAILWAIAIVVIWIFQSGHHRQTPVEGRRLAMLSASTVILAMGALVLTFTSPG